MAERELILDLDCPGTWHSGFGALVDAPEARQAIQGILNAGEDACYEFLDEFGKQEQFVETPVAVQLRRQAVDILLRRYGYVAAYHGCRPRDPDSYRERGILPSNTQELLNQARELFAGMPGFDDALKDLEEHYPSYRPHNEGRVWLLFSSNVKEMPGCFHHRGSELIGGIAHRIGPDAESRFAATGKPTIIKCAIPVEWLGSQTVDPATDYYAHSAIAAVVRQRIWPEKAPKAVAGGFALTRGVPPENIMEFIEVPE
jgi:hypothetical protein